MEARTMRRRCELEERKRRTRPHRVNRGVARGRSVDVEQELRDELAVHHDRVIRREARRLGVVGRAMSAIAAVLGGFQRRRA